MPRKLDPAVAALLAPEHRPSDPEPDPLADVKHGNGLENDCNAEIDAIAAGFRHRMNRENDRFRRATDTEHWFAVCFIDRAAKERFIAAIGGTDLGDKYLDGHELARRLGIAI